MTVWDFTPYLIDVGSSTQPAVSFNANNEVCQNVLRLLGHFNQFCTCRLDSTKITIMPHNHYHNGHTVPLVLITAAYVLSKDDISVFLKKAQVKIFPEIVNMVEIPDSFVTNLMIDLLAAFPVWKKIVLNLELKKRLDEISKIAVKLLLPKDVDPVLVQASQLLLFWQDYIVKTDCQYEQKLPFYNARGAVEATLNKLKALHALVKTHSESLEGLLKELETNCNNFLVVLSTAFEPDRSWFKLEENMQRMLTALNSMLNEQGEFDLNELALTLEMKTLLQ